MARDSRPCLTASQGNVARQPGAGEKAVIGCLKRHCHRITVWPKVVAWPRLRTLTTFRACGTTTETGPSGDPSERPGFPHSPATRAALAVAEHYSTPSLLNHARRCYLWAQAYADLRGIDHDTELLYVAELLHDSAWSRRSTTKACPSRKLAGTSRGCSARPRAGQRTVVTK